MSAYSIASRGLAGRKIPQGVLAPMNALLFGASEPGAWYDPSDLSTLFQDTAGTTPVTAVEQAVALMLDKSGRGNHASQATSTKRPRYSRRVNLLTNSEFTGYTAGTPGTAPTGWVNSQVTGSLAAGTSAGLKFIVNGTRRTITQIFNVQANASYLWKVKVNVVVPHAMFYPANIFRYIPAGATVTGFVLSLDGAAYSAGSEVLTAGTHTIVVKIDIGATGGSIYMSAGAGTASGVGLVGEIDMWEPQVVLLIDANLPYQSVNTPTDYDADTAKFPAYLRFDGVDDALQTGNIDFTGTDKMTVWAGVTKLSDAAPSTLLELSVNSYSNLGTIGLFTPTTVNGNDIAQRSIGNSERVLTVGGFTSPMSFVVTGYMGITPPIIGLRIAGSVIGTTSASQGTGNYGNYPLYIGARAGASLFFNGRLYSLIVRGAATPLPQIEVVETLIRQKMRLP